MSTIPPSPVVMFLVGVKLNIADLPKVPTGTCGLTPAAWAASSSSRRPWSAHTFAKVQVGGLTGVMHCHHGSGPAGDEAVDLRWVEVEGFRVDVGENWNGTDMEH